MKNKHLNTVWKMRTYDVWGNARDGYQVNDVYSHGSVELRLLVETANQGTLQEFKYAFPTESQIRSAFGIRCQLSMNGDDTTIYVNRERDSYPIGELQLVSHASLSPISWERLRS